MKNCDLNTCSERVPAQCVLLTCPVLGTTGHYILLEGCNPTLCDYLAGVDLNIQYLRDEDGIVSSRLNAQNCAFVKIQDLIDTRDPIYLKVRTSNAIITLLDIICDLKAQIDCMLLGDCIWDLPLHPDILNDPLFETCIRGTIDPCNPLVPVTLKDLLIRMMHVMCPRCCP